MNYRIAKLEDASELDNLLTKLIEDERTKYDNLIEPMVVQIFIKMSYFMITKEFTYAKIKEE